MARLLDWSRSAFGRQCGFEVVDVGSFRGGVTETLVRVSEGWFMILLQIACRDPDEVNF